MAEEIRELRFWAIDEDGNGFVDADGLNGPVRASFPLEPGDPASVFTRASIFLGTDGSGGGIFQDNADARQYFLSDTVQLSEGDPVPEPEEGDLPTGLPQISFSTSSGVAQFDEGDEGETKFEFQVERTGPDLSGTSTVDVAFTAGDTDAADFGGTLPETETVTFAPGETVKTVTINVSGDIDPESDETFGLRLESPTGAEIDSSEGGGSALGTIWNDDEVDIGSPVISIAPDNADQDEGDEGTTDYTFTVTRTGDDLSGTSTVDVAFTAGDTDAADFGGTLPETQTVTFGPGETEKTVVITGSGDTDVEVDETFEVSLEFATNAIIAPTASSAEGTIINDDEFDFNVIDGTDGPDVLQGTDGNDIIRGFDDTDILFGGEDNDIMDGGDDEDVLFGGEDNDILDGGNNSDVLFGGAGNDILIGGDGEDVLRGGEDNDILTGGLRSDAFQFEGEFGNDVITDFDDNQDGVFFEGTDSDTITAEVFVNGTLLTVESEDTNGTVLLLGITDVDGFNI